MTFFFPKSGGLLLITWWDWGATNPHASFPSPPFADGGTIDI